MQKKPQIISLAFGSHLGVVWLPSLPFSQKTDDGKEIWVEWLSPVPECLGPRRSQNSRSELKLQPGIYRLRLGHKIKSSTVSPEQEPSPRARMVGPGSLGDTCSGLLQSSIPERYTCPPPPSQRAVGQRSTTDSQGMVWRCGKSTKLGVGDLSLPHAGHVTLGSIVLKVTTYYFLLNAGHCARHLSSCSPISVIKNPGADITTLGWRPCSGFVSFREKRPESS